MVRISKIFSRYRYYFPSSTRITNNETRNTRYAPSEESIMGKMQENGRPLLLENLYDQLLSLVLEKINPGHEASLSLCFSSCRPREGTSTIAFNMALALSRYMGKNILLIDANTRTPKLHSWFQVDPAEPGLVDVLCGNCTFEEAVKKDKEGHLSFMPAGAEVNHPIILFDSKPFDHFLTTAREQYDIILFDAPSLVLGPETTVLARKLDGFVLVVEAEKTRWEVAKYQKQQLADAGVRFTGAILNKKMMFIPRFIYRLLLAD